MAAEFTEIYADERKRRVSPTASRRLGDSGTVQVEPKFLAVSTKQPVRSPAAKIEVYLSGLADTMQPVVPHRSGHCETRGPEYHTDDTQLGAENSEAGNPTAL
jgi:hypothetical protein